MHKKKPSATAALTGQLLENTMTDPAQRRAPEPPADVLTPERAEARGLATPGAVVEHVRLYETAPFVPNKNVTLKTEKVDGESVTTVKLDVAYCDVINRNGRYYPRSCYEAANARAQADIAEGGLWSLMDHPEWWEPVKGSLPNVVIKITELGIEDRSVEWPIGSGNKRTLGVVWAKGEIIETAKGKDAKALLKGKVKVGVSTNGWATTQYVRAGDLDPNYYDPEELIPVTQDDFTYFSIDLVSDPSNLGGRASTEARQTLPSRPAAPETTPKEGTMHELLKKLLEKYPGKTLEQIKAEHAAEYMQALEQIAQEATEEDSAPAPATAPVMPTTVPSASAPATAPAPAPAPAATETPLPTVDYTQPTVNMEAYRALESRVVALSGENDRLREQFRNQVRDTIALRALEAARLPSSGTFEVNGTKIDLDAGFREDLIAGARAARTDADAERFVNQKITERSALVGRQTRESAPAAGPFDYLSRTVNPGPSVPNAQPDQNLQEGYAPLQQAFSELL